MAAKPSGKECGFGVAEYGGQTGLAGVVRVREFARRWMWVARLDVHT